MIDNYRSWKDVPIGLCQIANLLVCLSECPRLMKVVIFQYDDALFDSLIAYDDKCFIAAGSQVRRDFLKAWVDIKDSAACLAFANGNVVGYGCLRPSLVGTSHLIGPLYADSKDIAKDLIRTLIKSVAASEVTLDIWYVICLHMASI